MGWEVVGEFLLLVGRVLYFFLFVLVYVVEDLGLR